MRNYARAIGTESGLVGPSRAKFPFVDISTGQRWQVDLGGGRLPTWVFDRARRVPDTGLLDYLKLAPILWAGADELVGNTIPCDGMLYRRLVQPLLLAALNAIRRRARQDLPAPSCGKRCSRAARLAVRLSRAPE